MADTGVGTAIVDYSTTFGGWGQGPYAAQAVAIWIPRGILDLLTHPKSYGGTTTPGGTHFGHQGRLQVMTDGPGTAGGTQSILVFVPT